MDAVKAIHRKHRERKGLEADDCEARGGPGLGHRSNVGS